MTNVIEITQYNIKDYNYYKITQYNKLQIL